MLFYLAVILLSAGLSAASYPAEYPFEKESVVPEAPLAATPSWTFDENDAGGYIYTYAYKLEITEDMFPFCFMNHGFFSHQSVTRGGAPPIQPVSVWNCTARGNLLGSYSYFGVVADIKICDEGECCKDTWGVYTLFDASSPYPPYYDDFGKLYTDGGCSEMFGEEVYCTFMAAYHQFACTNQFISTTEREHVYPCHDSVYNHYMGCTLYKTVGVMWRPSEEPEAYLEQNSAAQVNTLNGLFWSPDKVCQPYSYYHPETAKTESSSAGSSSTGNSDASPASSFAAIAIAALAFLQ
jgi:hypothetical protein